MEFQSEKELARVCQRCRVPRRRKANTSKELTFREVQIASCLIRGFSNQEIATALHLTLGTVKVTMSHAFRKLGVENRVQLALLAYKDAVKTQERI